LAGKTSNKLKTRLPARKGLGFQEPDDQKVSGEITDRVLGKCGYTGQLSKLSGQPLELEGYYRLDQEAHSLFLKVLPEAYLDQQIEANQFAVFVQKAGILSNTIISGFPKRLDDELVVIAYDWIEGRCLEPSSLELEQFGRQLGRLHQVLACYPEQEAVCNSTFARLADLRDIAKRIILLKPTDSPYLQRLCRLLDDKPDIFKPFEEPCQVLHGDLNVGNLRYTASGVVFLDFEDARHSWFPPRVDVAFALERLALINEQDDNRAFTNAQALLKGYVDVFGRSPFSRAGSLRETLEWLSLRSLCMLQHFEWVGRPWPESEWLKFDNLLNHIVRRSEMMLEIETYFFDR